MSDPPPEDNVRSRMQGMRTGNHSHLKQTDISRYRETRSQT